MFTSPIALTIGAQAYSLKLKNQDNFGSLYMDNTTVAGTEVKLALRHAYEGKAKNTLTTDGYRSTQTERHIADLTVTTFDAAGFPKVTQSYLHLRNPRGAVVGAVADVSQALSAWVTANADNFAGWEI